MAHLACGSIGWTVLWAATVGLTVLTAAPADSANGAQPKIPFPAALDAAAVVQERLAGSAQHALILGNGDVNGLLHADGSGLVLRLTKNDVWDARLDSKLDPPVPTMKRIKEMTAAGQIAGGGRAWILPAGSTWRGPDSYHAHPYPCPRACAVVRIGAGAGSTPGWRCIRQQGRRNTFQRRGTVTVMSIQGKAGASCGWTCGPLGVSTESYSRLRLRLSGSANARHYVDVMASGGEMVGGTRKWIDSPTETAEVVLDLARGKKVDRLILYTWTKDGRPAENRYASAVFEGPKGKRPVDLMVTPPETHRATLDIRRAAALVQGAKKDQSTVQVRALAGRNAFLIHAADVEGKREGIQKDLVQLLGAWSPIPTTYAGGATSLADLGRVDELGHGRVDLTIGSALDIFGGDIPYREVVRWHQARNPAPAAEELREFHGGT